MFKKVSQLCVGCVKITKKSVCFAIKDPQYFWDKYGECFAFEDDPGWLGRYHQEAQKYAELKHLDAVGKAE